MAIKPLNSVAGYSVGEYPSTVIINSNGNVTTGNLTATSNVDFTSAGNVSLGAVGNVKITGGSSGYYLQTNGSGGLSWAAVPSGNGIANGSSNVTIPVASGNIVMYVNGGAIANVTSTGINVFGTLNATGNANVGNLGTAQVLATANITAPQLISNVATGTAPLVVSSTTLVSNLNADLLDGLNSATANTASTIAARDSSGNLSANFFIGNGSQLTGLNTATISNGNSNVNIPAANGNVNISAVGNANVVVVTGTGVNVAGTLNTGTGNANVGNIGATRGVFTNIAGEGGNISNIQGANVSGTVSSATTAGTVTTAAQPNITSVGTLTSLAVTGNVTAGNLIGPLANGNSSVNIPAANGNINLAAVGNTTMVITGTGANITGTLNASGNANVGNLGTAQVLATANITAPQLISNVATGTAPFVVTSTTQVANLNVASAGTAGTATTAGTVTTAAQPNITSVGTLTSLAVTGNVTAGNVYANAGIIGALTLKGEGGNISNIQGANVSGTVSSATTAGTVTTAAQPNITSVGTLTSLAVTGNVTAGNIIGVFANGNSNVSIPAANGNVNISAAGNANIVVVTGTGANITGTLNASGNANVGNLGTSGLITATGNVSGGNLTTGGVVAATGNITSSANLISDNILGRTGALTITSAGTNTNINLKPNGTGNIDANSTYITNVKDPSSAQDAATKQYVDNLASTAIAYHQPVNVATTTTLATATGGTTAYNSPNGAANGIGAYISTTGTFNLIDGSNVQTVGTRILVKDESNAAWNGIYTYTNATAITRSLDADEYGPNSSEQLSVNDYFFVQGGTVNKGSSYIVNAPTGTITFGTSLITFAQFSTSQVYDAGTGLTLSNTTFSISNTAVTAGSYGNGDRVATFTVNSQGQLTAAANTAITANAANLTGTTLNSSIVTSSLTSVGTLGSLAVTGNATVGNLIGPHANGNSNVNIPAANGNVNISAAGNANILVVTGTGANITGTLNATGNANVGNLGTATAIITTGNITTINSGLLQNGTSNVTLASGGNVSTFIGGNSTAQLIVTSTGANIAGYANVVGNITSGNISATNGNLTTANVSGNVILGNSSVTTRISWGSVTTTSVTANQTIASFSVTGVTGVEFLVKGIDSTGSKYSVATVTAVTDGANVDYSTFGTVNLGGYTGALAVNVTGSVMYLQVTPASSNSTVWTTQYRFI